MSTAEPAAVHPVLAALARAPVGAPFTADERAELDRAIDDIRAGSARLVREDDIPTALEEMYRQDHGE